MELNGNLVTRRVQGILVLEYGTEATLDGKNRRRLEPEVLKGMADLKD